MEGVMVKEEPMDDDDTITDSEMGTRKQAMNADVKLEKDMDIEPPHAKIPRQVYDHCTITPPQFLCMECGYSCGTQWELNVHQADHTDMIKDEPKDEEQSSTPATPASNISDYNGPETSGDESFQGISPQSFTMLDPEFLSRGPELLTMTGASTTETVNNLITVTPKLEPDEQGASSLGPDSAHSHSSASAKLVSIIKKHVPNQISKSVAVTIQGLVDPDGVGITPNMNSEVQADRTQRQTKWGVSIFTEWCNFAGHDSKFEELPAVQLGELMTQFYACVRQQDGSPYSHSSMLCIRSALQRHLSAPPFNRNINIHKDVEFIAANAVVGGTVRKQKERGEEYSKVHPPITPSDIALMYSSGTLSDDNPRSLQFKTFFELSLHFGKWGRQGLRNLTKRDIVFKYDDNGVEYATLSEKHQLNEHEPKMYATGDANCPLYTLKEYIAKLNLDCEYFFQKPKAKDFKKSVIWYVGSPVGVNTIGRFMSTISECARLSGRYTNHCIWATTMKSLREAGLNPSDIVAVSEQGSLASVVRQSKTTDTIRRHVSYQLSTLISNIIEPKKLSTSVPDIVPDTVQKDSLPPTLQVQPSKLQQQIPESNARFRESNDLAVCKLLRLKPGPNEGMLDFTQRLQENAEKCDFTNWTADKMVKCLVISNMSDEKLRTSCLEQKLGLDQVLDRIKLKEDDVEQCTKL